MKKIEANIIADSINPKGDRITTYILTYPRIIHGELMTHRVFSRNSASSRAIPFEKMVKSVTEDPFIPIAFQKGHKGMQGTEYLSKTHKYNLNTFVSACIDTLNTKHKDSKEYLIEKNRIKEKVNLVTNLLKNYINETKTLDEWWIFARDKAIETASILYVFDVTKQLCNRLLEPFMWHTVLVTATEYDNFFELRCPRYRNPDSQLIYKSKKDFLIKGCLDFSPYKAEDWYSIDESQAEIHIQALAEAMWDEKNESAPKQLKAGEWHIPFGDRIDDKELQKISIWRDEYGDVHGPFYKEFDEEKVINLLKIATARAARLSYMTFENNIDYQKDIELHDRLLESKHVSPMEHCAQAQDSSNWYANFKGWKSYRKFLEEDNKLTF